MLIDRLPRYMVPQHIVVVDRMPLTPHGKIDEEALAAVDVAEATATPPETPTATDPRWPRRSPSSWGTRRVDVTADFLQLGLDSIVALSVVQAAPARGIALRARLMVECDNIRELAAAIDSDAAAAAPDGTTARADPVAAQRPLALRVRRTAAAGADRSHPAAQHHQPRAAGRRAGKRRRRPRGAPHPAGPRHDDPGSGADHRRPPPKSSARSGSADDCTRRRRPTPRRPSTASTPNGERCCPRCGCALRPDRVFWC